MNARTEEEKRAWVAEMKQFKEDIITMDRVTPELTKTHPNHWLGVYKGKIYVHRTYAGLQELLQADGVPRTDAAEVYLTTLDKSKIII